MDNPATVLVVFGVIGYLILRHCCHRTAFRWETLEWQQNVFESTGFGLLLFFLARLASTPTHSLIDSYALTSSIQGYVAKSVPVPFMGSAILGAAIGVMLAWGMNLGWPKDRALARVVENHGGRLKIILHDAHRSERPVMLSLNNRKVYVGAVAVPPPLREPSHVVILPTISGYRDEGTLEIGGWTTEYTNVFLEIVEAIEKGEQPETDLRHFQLVIPLSAILSATYFDFEIWERHFKPKAESPAPPLPADWPNP